MTTPPIAKRVPHSFARHGITIEDPYAWLRDPGAIKPGNYMASVIQPGTLSEEAIDAIAEFLFSLEPDEGCGSILPGEGTENYDAALIGLGD